MDKYNNRRKVVDMSKDLCERKEGTFKVYYE